MIIQIYSSGIIWTIISANYTRVRDQTNIQMYQKPHILGSKNYWGMQSKRVFKICEGRSCSSLYVKKFDVIVHKTNSYDYQTKEKQNKTVLIFLGCGVFSASSFRCVSVCPCGHPCWSRYGRGRVKCLGTYPRQHWEVGCTSVGF